jgi:penicillin amidase
LKKLFLSVAIALVMAGAAAGVWAWHELSASLPQLDGERHLPGVSAVVTVARDAQGIPTIRGANRPDVARATGFLHAQDRFFAMDLARRRAAGELSALVGERTLLVDREIRGHRLRAVARRAVELLRPDDRVVLDAYVAGVNAGLHALGARPWEYLLLGQQPEPWRPEDSLLVVLSMFVTLQDPEGAYESTIATMNDLLPPEMVNFLTPDGTEWDTPVIGAAFVTPPIPPAGIYDARSRRRGKLPIELPKRPEETRDTTGLWRWHPGSMTDGLAGISLGSQSDTALGSNNFAVAGHLTRNGGALLANDMHLFIRVPNIWYRAAFEWPGTNPAEPHRLYGVTLPGVPAMVAGSNTHVAWGFTNTYGDWGDIVLLETDPGNPRRYRTPDGWREFERHRETIQVAERASEQETVDWTIWGPVLRPDHRGRPRAYRWVAHSPEMLAASIAPIETATTLEEVFDSANGAGTPAQNVVAVDRGGRIGWTIYGTIPRRVGFDGKTPTSWADGQRGWQGWLRRDEYPRIIDPPDGRIWTANARVVNGEMLARIGHGSFEVGSRARIIRDRLYARDRFSPTDLLDIQLDASASFLERWRTLILRTLTPETTAGHAPRAAFRDLVEHDWRGSAAPGSAGYRLTRATRDRIADVVFAFVLADCYEADDHFDYMTERKREGPLWRMVTERPMHLLDTRYDSWDALVIGAIDKVIEDAARKGTDLSRRTWAEFNVTAYRHPLSSALPFAWRWLDMPQQQLPGDLYTPRVAWGSIAASERMIVSPGREQDGIMEMPTGQSGHPLSPHYHDSHAAWVRGEPTPFLPGPAVHILTFRP